MMISCSSLNTTFIIHSLTTAKTGHCREACTNVPSPPKAALDAFFLDVRSGSKADICSAPTHVRFTPNSDRKNRDAQMVMSALPLKADMCGATRDVRFGPKADIRCCPSPKLRPRVQAHQLRYWCS